MDSPRPATTSAYTCQNPEVRLHYQSELGSLLITRMPFHCALSNYCIQTIRENLELCRVEIKTGLYPCPCILSQCRSHINCEGS